MLLVPACKVSWEKDLKTRKGKIKGIESNIAISIELGLFSWLGTEVITYTQFHSVQNQCLYLKSELRVDYWEMYIVVSYNSLNIAHSRRLWYCLCLELFSWSCKIEGVVLPTSDFSRSWFEIAKLVIGLVTIDLILFHA